MANEYTRLKVKYPEWLADEDRREFLEDCITQILERTAQGQGAYKRGRGYQIKPFPGYEKEYAKEKGSKSVNLELDGDMLDSLRVINLKDGIIGITGEQEGKAEGNIRGTYGKQTGKKYTSKSRQFLGLTASELASIAEGFEREADE